MHIIVTWILALMIAHAPTDRVIFEPAARETPQEMEARYISIATDIAEVAYDPHEVPIFPGERGRLQTAALLAGIAYWEGSRYQRDVDTGIGPHARGDHGNSVCLMQINIGKRRTAEGYTAEDLLADRQKCFRTGLHIAQLSFHMCGNLAIQHRLSAYASGSCSRGRVASQQRVMTGIGWYWSHKPTFTDTDILERIIFEKRPASRFATDPSPTASSDPSETFEDN